MNEEIKISIGYNEHLQAFSVRATGGQLQFTSLIPEEEIRESKIPAAAVLKERAVKPLMALLLQAISNVSSCERLDND